MERFEYEEQRNCIAIMRSFVRFYEFLLQVSSFEDTDLHKKYNYIAYLLAYINIKHPGGGFNLDGKIKATNFVQKKGEEHTKPIDSFKQKSNSLLERYGNGAGQHYQYENAICTYLWLRYPDKYYIYKLSEIKAVSSELESDYIFKKGAYADNIRNFLAFYNEICAELQQDEELKNMLASQITGTCYPDPELRTLTIDVC